MGAMIEPTALAAGIRTALYAHLDEYVEGDGVTVFEGEGEQIALSVGGFDFALVLTPAGRAAPLVMSALLEALQPFEREFEDAGLGAHLPDDKLMLDVDAGGEVLTVGHWRQLIAAIAKARGGAA